MQLISFTLKLLFFSIFPLNKMASCIDFHSDCFLSFLLGSLTGRGMVQENKLYVFSNQALPTPLKRYLSCFIYLPNSVARHNWLPLIKAYILFFNIEKTKFKTHKCYRHRTLIPYFNTHYDRGNASHSKLTEDRVCNNVFSG